MRLCFGTYATILYRCLSDTKTTQTMLIAELAKIVDKESRYQMKNDPDIQKPEANKLLRCNKNFILSEGKDTNIPTLKMVIKEFNDEVRPIIDEDKKAKAILALLDIIKKDKYLDFDQKENFKKYFGVEKKDLLKRSELEFSDIFGRTLMYTVYGNVDNTVGKECVKSITNDYIDNVAKSYLHKYQWNSDKDILTLFLAPMFNSFQRAIKKYKIYDFLRYTDPTDKMNIEWPERLDDFVEYINRNILNSSNSNLTGRAKSMFEKIKKFTEILDKYNEYLGKHMNFISDGIKFYWVPQYRDENAKWAWKFNKVTEGYHKQLVSIYEDIHTIFSSDNRNIKESNIKTSE